MNITIEDKTKLKDAAKKFLRAAEGHRLFAFYGQMGAGKTTFIKAICHELGVTDIVTSPTFTLINEYRCPGMPSVFHFDFYRIKDISEVFDFGFEEYIDGSSYCFMEWPEKIGSILPDDVIRVSITENSDGSRSVTADTI